MREVLRRHRHGLQAIVGGALAYFAAVLSVVVGREFGIHSLELFLLSTGFLLVAIILLWLLAGAVRRYVETFDTLRSLVISHAHRQIDGWVGKRREFSQRAIDDAANAALLVANGSLRGDPRTGGSGV